MWAILEVLNRKFSCVKDLGCLHPHLEGLKFAQGGGKTRQNPAVLDRLRRKLRNKIALLRNFGGGLRRIALFGEHFGPGISASPYSSRRNSRTLGRSRHEQAAPASSFGLRRGKPAAASFRRAGTTSWQACRGVHDWGQEAPAGSVVDLPRAGRYIAAMRVVVTGQVGLDKKHFLQRVLQAAPAQGQDVAVAHIGDMMYAEAPDVAPGKILDLPLSRLNGLRRSVFKDVLASCQDHRNVIVNTHATFRWRHGLFYAFDYDQMKQLAADLYIVLLDSVDRVHWRLLRDGHTDHTLKDLMVWREEEMLATELLAQIVRGHGCFYIMAVGEDESTALAVSRLIFQPAVRKAYLSFPMTHVNGRGGRLMEEIENFRRRMKQHFTCFDPGDVEEKHLSRLALDAAEQGVRTIETGPPSQKAAMEVSQLLDIVADIDGQIYARDFKLIDQAEMIVSLVPATENGEPAISSGVERELQHAHEATKDVFVIWRPKREPSPFITETATRVFADVDEAIAYFMANRYIVQPGIGGLFGA